MERLRRPSDAQHLLTGTDDGAISPQRRTIRFTGCLDVSCPRRDYALPYPPWTGQLDALSLALLSNATVDTRWTRLSKFILAHICDNNVGDDLEVAYHLIYEGTDMSPMPSDMKHLRSLLGGLS